MRNGKGSPAFARGKDRGGNSSAATGSTPPFPHFARVLAFLCQGEKGTRKRRVQKEGWCTHPMGGTQEYDKGKERQESDCVHRPGCRLTALACQLACRRNKYCNIVCVTHGVCYLARPYTARWFLHVKELDFWGHMQGDYVAMLSARQRSLDWPNDRSYHTLTFHHCQAVSCIQFGLHARGVFTPPPPLSSFRCCYVHSVMRFHRLIVRQPH